MLKSVFGLSLRSTEEFIRPLSGLMDVPLALPDYSHMSQLTKSVKVAYRSPSHSPVFHVVSDAMKLKGFGEAE